MNNHKKIILDLLKQSQDQDAFVSELLELFSCKGCVDKPKLGRFRKLTFGSKIPKELIPGCFECGRFYDDYYRRE